MSPKVCKCGLQAANVESRQRTDYVYRRYVCECGEVWSTKEFRVSVNDTEIAIVKGKVADKLIELAQELLKC